MVLTSGADIEYCLMVLTSGAGTEFCLMVLTSGADIEYCLNSPMKVTKNMSCARHMIHSEAALTTCNTYP